MFDTINVLTYAVLIGCEFFALCAMTRGGRGLIPRILGLVSLAAVDVAMEFVWNSGTVPADMWIAVQFTVCWIVVSGLIVWLSRDSLGRRIFLSLCYGTYALGYASCFNVIAYRPFTGIGECRAIEIPHHGFIAVGLAIVVLLNLAFVFLILPRLPRDGRNFRWADSCLVVGVMFAAMFSISHWPVSVVIVSVRDCLPFVLMSLAAWIVFPMVCGRMRDRQRAADIAHSLELMMAEVKERRAAIDLARRLRHDQRHHRAQIAEYMLAGQYDRVFDYLKALDEEAQIVPTDKFIWCDNETVNAVLSGAFRRALAKGVTLEVAANVERTIGVPDVDLVALVANLIENAIKACGEENAVKDESDDERRKVCVALRQREHGLGITVTNPVPKGFALSDRGFPCAEPGVGLESIRNVIERHDGQWSYELNGDTLKCQVILMFPLPCRRTDACLSHGNRYGAQSINHL